MAYYWNNKKEQFLVFSELIEAAIIKFEHWPGKGEKRNGV